MDSKVAFINATRITTETWFIPADIFLAVCSLVTIFISLLFLTVLAVDKSCHTIPMLLVANSCLTTVVVGCVTLHMALFALHNDLQRIDQPDALCIARAYIGYASYGTLNFSFFLQALYRHVSVVSPNSLYWQSSRFQLLAIAMTWLYGFTYPLALAIPGAIVYNADNQICQKAVQFSFYTLYGAFCAYTAPISAVGFIYWRLVLYVRSISRHLVVCNSLTRAQRELRMVRRTVTLLVILIAVSFPYILIMFMSFFTAPPKYHFRIVYLFVDTSILVMLLVLFQFTEPLKTSLLKRLRPQPVLVVIVRT